MNKELPVAKSGFPEFVELIKKKAKLFDFVAEHEADNDFINDIIKNLENVTAFEVDDVLYEGLFQLYQNGNMRCQMFVLQFAPSLISVYLALVGCRIMTGGGKLETLLLSIYNKEAATNVETPFAKSYRIPSLSNSSVYHEPASTMSSALTERALSRHEQSDKPILLKVPSKILSRITASSRSEVLNAVLDAYNCNISAMVEPSHLAFCKMATRISRSGFSHLDGDDSKLTSLLEKSELDSIKHYTRIKLTNDVFQQMVTGLYFIMYDGLADEALVALKNLENMSRHTLNASLTMTLNAITANIERSFQERDIPLSRNPRKTTRRVLDSTKRRYAFTKSPALLTPNPDAKTGSGKEHVIISVDETDSSVVAVDRNGVDDISAEDFERVSIPDQVRINKNPSESEEESANESTSLLDKKGPSTDSKNFTNHESIRVNIIPDSVENFKHNVTLVDTVNDYQLIDSKLDSEGKIETLL